MYKVDLIAISVIKYPLLNMNLAEEFFGTEEISHDPSDMDSRRSPFAEVQRTVRVWLEAVGPATPGFPRGLGAKLTANEPVRTGWILSRYAKEMAAFFEHFAYLGVPCSLSNRINNVPDGLYTPEGNVFMHVDGRQESLARSNWDFTQLFLPEVRGNVLRTDPTNVADTLIFTPKLMAALKAYVGKKDVPHRREIKTIYEMAKNVPPKDRVTVISAMAKLSTPEVRVLMLELQREAYAASQGYTAEFYYNYGVEGDSHLVVPASGLSSAYKATHGRLGYPNGRTPLDSALYPIVPRGGEGPEAQRIFWGEESWERMRAA